MAGLSLRYPYVIQRKPLTAIAEYGSSGRSDVVLQTPHTRETQGVVVAISMVVVVKVVLVVVSKSVLERSCIGICYNNLLHV
jgi:hypothetical protein